MRPVYNARLLERSLDTALATRRLQGVLVAGFAIVAFVIALLGIYALFNHSVRQRDRELGIRLALGAAPRDVVTLVLHEAFVRVALGISLGVIVALALGGLMRSSLFGITPWNPGIMTAAATLPAIGALLASYLPARRAGRVPPMAALGTD
jgi:putative ABC transport system permease protein